MAGSLLSQRFYDRWWLPYLKAGLLGATVGNRNRTFVATTNSVFQDNPDVDCLLVIVGREHVPGMSNLFKEQHAWCELEVAGQKEGF